MRKFNKTYLIVLILLALFWAISLVAESGDKWTSSYDRANGNSHWRVDSSGDLVPGKDGSYDLGNATYQIEDLFIDGTATVDVLTVDETSTFAGIPTLATGVSLGILTSVPTSGYAEGSVIYIKTGYNKLFVSTATVTTASCWVQLH